VFLALFLQNVHFMCVLRCYNSTKIGCFSSINNKVIKSTSVEHFQPNFRRPLAAKLLKGSTNVTGIKWWHGHPLSSYWLWWIYARQCERTKCRVFSLSLIHESIKFFVTVSAVNHFGDVMGYCNKHRSLGLFVGRFYTRFAVFLFGEEKPFPMDRTDSKTVAKM